MNDVKGPLDEVERLMSAGEHTEAVELFFSERLDTDLLRLGRLEELEIFYNRALGFDLPGKLRSVVLGGLGNALLAAKKNDEAEKCFKRAAEISEELGEKRSLGIWLGNLGCISDQRWDYEKAIEYFERAIALARETEDKIHESWWLGTLGSVYFELGDVHKAIEHLANALSISEETLYKRGIRYQASWLNRISIELGDEKRAEYYLDKFIEHREDDGD
jgi:tetratricopeptide (TPR) repeat protein